MKNIAEIMRIAREREILIPAMNIAHLPMTRPMIEAAVDTGTFALMEVSRVDWNNFGAESLKAVFLSYQKYKNENNTRLHLDHIPVIDENQVRLDYMAYISEAVELGYDSVMIDGSRLSLADNIAAAAEVCELAHENGVAVEAELGAVLGHEAGPIPPYEDLIASGRGFTDVAEAVRFVEESGCDWLSVAVGNIHGAITGAAMDQKKLEARINLEHLSRLNDALGVPLVLHGGSGINLDYVRKSVKSGITKMNIGSDLRQTYEKALKDHGRVEKAQKRLYDRCCEIYTDELLVAGKAQQFR
ncbi:MAG: class II fructose-bisphosphate aldolase [Spirochaetales bacterium]|nr:class II fructose-bisphosphate aldolase [Spirochaetales bacterium]